MADAKSAGVVSFAFSKKTDRVQLASSKLGDDSTKADNEETDYVKSLEGKQINRQVIGAKHVVVCAVINASCLVIFLLVIQI